MTINWPLMGTFTSILTKELTTLQIQIKGRQCASFIGGLGYISRSMLCMVQHVILTCVGCVIFFNYDVDIVNMEEYISTIYKRFKMQKNCQFLNFCVVYILHITYTTILVTMGSILL